MTDNQSSGQVETATYNQYQDNSSYIEEQNLVTKKERIVEIPKTSEEQIQPQQPKKTSGRVYWVDCLRIFSSFLVVLTHHSWFNFNRDYGTYEWKIPNIYLGLSRSCVPFFVMISGIFFLKPKKKITYKQIYAKYVLRMVKAYIFWSIFYTIVYPHFIKKEPDINFVKNKEDFIGAIRGSILGSYHLWYLNFVIGLYIATPIFKAITADYDLAIYTTILSCLVFQVIPTTLRYLKLFDFGVEYFSVLSEFFDKLKIEMGGSYAVYYLLGYILSVHDFKKKSHRYIIYVLGFLATVVTPVLYIYHSNKSKKNEALFVEFYNFHVTVSTVGGFVFFKYAVNSWIQPLLEKEWFVKTLNILSECSFGVYLWHMAINKFFSVYNFTCLFIDPIFGVPIISVINYVVSFILTYLMKQVPYLRSVV